MLNSRNDAKIFIHQVRRAFVSMCFCHSLVFLDWLIRVLDCSITEHIFCIYQILSQFSELTNDIFCHLHTRTFKLHTIDYVEETKIRTTSHHRCYFRPRWRATVFQPKSETKWIKISVKTWEDKSPTLFYYVTKKYELYKFSFN